MTSFPSQFDKHTRLPLDEGLSSAPNFRSEGAVENPTGTAVGRSEGWEGGQFGVERSAGQSRPTGNSFPRPTNSHNIQFNHTSAASLASSTGPPPPSPALDGMPTARAPPKRLRKTNQEKAEFLAHKAIIRPQPVSELQGDDDQVKARLKEITP